MSIFTATQPADSESVKLGASRIREMKTVLNTLLDFFFSDAAGTFKTNTVPGTLLQDASVDTAQLADEAVTSAKIEDGAVDTAELADASVTNAKLDLTDDGISLSKIDSASLGYYQNPIFNGSFEDVTTTVPNRWTLATFTGGTVASDAADSSHGGKSLKFTEVASNGNGGGTAITNYFIPVTDSVPIFLYWDHKCSAAGMKNRVELFWYDSSQVAMSTASTTIFESVASPSSWVAMGGGALPPTGTKFLKVKLTGGYNDTNPTGTHNAWFDNIRIENPIFTKGSTTVKSTTTWICPSDVYVVRATVIGGGGGGGDTNTGSPTAGGGGGAGGWAQSYIPVVPGTSYTMTVGAAGATTNNLPGTAGGSSSFVAGSFSVSATGGAGGSILNSGGAAGTGSGTGALTFSGTVGLNGSSAGPGGNGGKSHYIGLAAASGGVSFGSPGETPATTSDGYGGGGGANNGQGTAGAGASGRATLEY